MTEMYRRYRMCVIGIATVGEDGTESMGTGFHIGDGFLITARHVIENRQICGIVLPQHGDMGTIFSATYPVDDRIDLVLLSTDFSLDYYMTSVKFAGSDWPKSDAVLLGGHLDDWIGESMVLLPVLMMGFPPVPTSRYPVALAVTGEVNAALDRYTNPHVHFIVSSPARGGFSGGPVLYLAKEDGYLLGVVTASLQREGDTGEPGFAAVLSIEPILDLLAHARVAPRANRTTCYLLAQGSDDFKFESLLTAEELATFERWKNNITREPEPTSLGARSPRLQAKVPLWTKPPKSDDRF